MTSTLLILAGLATPTADAATLLYCRDLVFGDDAMDAALDASSHTITTTPDVAGTCNTLIGTGVFDLVVVAQQSSSVAVPALDARIAADLPTIVHDVSDTLMGSLGIGRTGANLSTISSIHPVLSAGIVSPTVTLSSVDWIEYSKSLSAGSAGVALADFEDTNSAILLVGTSVFFNGFFVDVADPSSAADMAQLFTNEIAFALAGGVDADGDGYLDQTFGGDDCDDADPGINPGEVETYYDGVDANCDGLSDDDADADGFASSTEGGTDCDDGDATINPSAIETYYDGVNQNCDALSDNDADFDGFDSDAEGGTDCDDADFLVNPDAIESYYDLIDQNCDGLSDFDADEDGFDAADDCNDTDPAVNPDAIENYYDGIDQNCDLASDYDVDGDGFDNSDYGGTDCNDADAAINTNAVEVYYDNVDQDCDSSSDFDADLDGFTSSEHGGTDCNDSDNTIHPAAVEVFYDGTNQDCGPGSDYDADGDGFEKDTFGGEDCDDDNAAVNPDAIEVVDGIDNDCNGIDESFDEDQDGLTNLDEIALGSDPQDNDTDADGMLDGEEFAEGTNLLDKDTDDDGLSDGAEWNVFFCDPLVQDTDGDGIGDATEVGRDYVTPHTLPGYFWPDADPTTTTDPNDADTDDDGLLDSDEDVDLDGAQTALETEPSAFDTDDDWLGDGQEMGLISPESADTDLAVFATDADPTTTTDPLVADTDGGGALDGVEDTDRNGRLDLSECDPNDPADDDNCPRTAADGDTGQPTDTGDSGEEAGVQYVYAGRGCNAAAGSPLGAAAGALALLLATRRRR